MKQALVHLIPVLAVVALFTSAWIETVDGALKSDLVNVALFTSAWIETLNGG